MSPSSPPAVFNIQRDPTYGAGAIVDLAKVSPMPKAGVKFRRVETRAL